MISHKIEFNAGESVALDFNEAKHQYSVGGEYVPAVTSVLGATIAKQKFLMPWAVKMGAEWFEEVIRPATRQAANEYLYTFKDNMTSEEIAVGIKKAYKSKLNKFQY